MLFQKILELCVEPFITTTISCCPRSESRFALNYLLSDTAALGCVFSRVIHWFSEWVFQMLWCTSRCCLIANWLQAWFFSLFLFISIPEIRGHHHVHPVLSFQLLSREIKRIKRLIAAYKSQAFDDKWGEAIRVRDKFTFIHMKKLLLKTIRWQYMYEFQINRIWETV